MKSVLCAKFVDIQNARNCENKQRNESITVLTFIQKIYLHMRN